MTDHNEAPVSGEEMYLFGLVSQYSVISGQVEVGGSNTQEIQKELGKLNTKAEDFFVDQAVTAASIAPGTSPIAAMTKTRFHRTPNGFNPGGDWESTHGFWLPVHPKKAQGTIEAINLRDARIEVKPRRFSPYALRAGSFLVKLLDENGNPQVKLNITRPT